MKLFNRKKKEPEIRYIVKTKPIEEEDALPTTRFGTMDETMANSPAMIARYEAQGCRVLVEKWVDGELADVRKHIPRIPEKPKPVPIDTEGRVDKILEELKIPRWKWDGTLKEAKKKRKKATADYEQSLLDNIEI